MSQTQSSDRSKVTVILGGHRLLKAPFDRFGSGRSVPVMARLDRAMTKIARS